MNKKQKRLLVVDDDENLCLIVKEKFGALGYQVLTANEGAEGIRRTEEGKPDCVILDIKITHGEDGLTYLRKLRSYCHADPSEQARIRNTPVIVLTGFGAGMKSVFEFEGIHGFLEKPFNLKNLQDKIESAISVS